MGSLSSATIECDAQDSNAHEEKIFVSVRLRPLNERELGKNDVSDWECINNTTIIFKNTFQERSLSSAAYTFDRVFGAECPTSQVYEDAAKKVVLSVLSGINSTIFAYGQTSSGKTYTMSGITDSSVADIYNYVDKHRERNFVLKFSAMEIYNEAVKDLLSTDGAQLRLLDDPERGTTIVDKLTAVTLRDSSHLKELLSMCESQRQTGETSLNEMSSRSHQILRLIVDSEAREYLGAENSSTLTASVNFVDLAGSERASQTLSAGTRLKEGCHINRSLLTLGTVIRKLSKGRNQHIPYRNSKLTRILQNSLGGNAKTAIICTMSPAHSHVEQSRNTLLFASCAKQVSTNAQVNVVMSEKALVKQLQKELSRLENELRNFSLLAASGDSAAALKEKESLIQKMDGEIRELTYQRDLAQSRVENMLKLEGEYQDSKSWASEYAPSEVSEIIDPFKSDVASVTSHFSDRYEHERINSISTEDPFLENNEEQFLADNTSPTLYIDKYFGPEPCQGWEKIGQETDKNSEDNCKEVQCIKIDFSKRNSVSGASSLQKEFQTSGRSPCSSDDGLSNPNVNMLRSRSCAAILTTIVQSSSFEVEKDDGVVKENEVSQDEANNHEKNSSVVPVADSEIFCIKCSQSSISTDFTQSSISIDFSNEKEENINNLGEDICIKGSQSSISIDSSNEKEENIKSLGEDCPDEKQEDYVIEINEVMKPELVKQIEDDLFDIPTTSDKVIKPKAVDQYNDAVMVSQKDTNEAKTSNNLKNNAEAEVHNAWDIDKSSSDWSIEFERQKKEIIELWDECNTSLIHRTYFLLLFKGDPSDSVYMEVELRQLSFLKNKLHGVVKDDKFFTRASSSKALNREREMLSKQMLKKLKSKEKEALYQKWGIYQKSKQRRLQLCRRIWTDVKNMDHINESAAIVAKLVGFKELGQAPKEMVGLSFSSKPVIFKSSSWKKSMSSMI